MIVIKHLHGLAKPLLSVAVSLLLVACAGPAQNPGTALLDARQRDANQLLPVNCRLPGMVMQLGTQFTYLAARQVIKTSGRDCEIRGGEYVAYDRANYATALKAWLPRAEAGDAVAQTYVGEIYEQGSGLRPDYKIAAQWYRKAAAQGNSRAQINLGALYEQGLGVRKDPTAALNWYRKASGLSDDQLAFTSSIEGLETERDTLRSELAQRDQEIGALRSQLAQTQGQLKTRRDRLQDAERELENTRRRLEQEQRRAPNTPAPNATPNPAADDSTRQLEQRLAQQQTLLEQQRQEIAYLQQQAERQRQQAQDLQQLQQDAAAKAQQQAELEQQLAYQQQQLSKYQTLLTTSRQELDAQKQQRQRVEQILQQQSTAANTQNQAEVAQLRQQLEASNVRLTQTQEQVETLETEVRQRQTELARMQVISAQQTVETGALQAQLQQTQQQLKTRQASLKETQNVLEDTRRQLAQQQSALQTASSQGAAIQQLQQRLTEQAALVQQQRQEMNALQREAERRQQEIQALQAIGSVPAELTTRAATREPDTAPTPTPELPKVNFGNYHGLIIGNNNYAHLSNLQTAVNDAQAVARTLETRYGFQNKVLLNADRYAILAALEEMRSKLTENDNFLLYYAGHGELNRSDDSGYWLPVDATLDNRDSWISNTAITDVLNTIPAKHIIVIADSCYSGTLARAITTSVEGGRASERNIKKWLELMVNVRSRTVITSGGVRPVLDSGGGSHSIFARALLDQLNGNRSVMEGPLLYQQVARQVKVASSRLNVDQAPRYAPIKFAGDLGAPFFFVPTDNT